MTEKEFLLLDELYFVIGFADLQAQIGWPQTELAAELRALIEKGWVRCLEGEVDVDKPMERWAERYADFAYLASKEGLLAHNTDA